MTDTLKWKQPPEVKEAEWRETVPLLRRINLQCAVYYLVLGVPTAVYCSNVLGTSLAWMLVRVAVAFLIMPLKLSVLWFVRKVRAEYEVSPKGILYDGVRYKWVKLQAYSFVDSDKLPLVRNLSIKLRGSDFLRTMPFHNGEVSEQEIAEIIGRFAPAAEARRDDKPTQEELEADCRTTLRRLRGYAFVSVLLALGTVASVIAICRGYLSGPVASFCFGCGICCIVCIGCFFVVKGQYKDALAKSGQGSTDPLDASARWYSR